MTKRMLIDAAHPEETRVVVLQDRQVLDFDFESAAKRQLKGNIYLAKITRVEPSLQAAFVEYGGNRHGFLAFSEIHPDYYQIPAADRAMLEDIEREAAAKAAANETELENGQGESDDVEVTQDADEETADVVDEYARRRAKLLRNYKIQEVIKRRQIMLVQVVKEERGNKGAALTTYLSLAGRYCVLMPNTPRGGGISRKIASNADRRRLKTIAQELEVPRGMGLIVRTAGAERSKAEIKRDYEYLIRLWNEIREMTLQSVAPALIYEEGSLIKRALRDLYTRDIEEVLVEGEEGYKSARRLMQMLMPSRARLVKLYEEEVPLFFRHQVEEKLEKIYNPVVQLASGGSIVIHTTEALTAIDVNSGRSTRERHIDETAVKTNLEAADEVARQLRLRDLAGLIVVDFIDMAESRHQRSVEKRLRDALKLDRARLQLGKISVFGLLELSRQRLRPSILELSTQVCPHCQGAGVVRSTESCALYALRLVQELGIKGETAVLRATVPADVGLYLLNQKREGLVRLEQRYDMRVLIEVSAHLQPPHVDLEVLEKREQIRADGEPAMITAEPPGAELRDRERDRPRETERERGRPGERDRLRDGEREPARDGERRPIRDGGPVRELDGEAEADRDLELEPEVSGAERPGRERPLEAEADDGAGRKRRRRRRRRRRPGEAGGVGEAPIGMAASREDEFDRETGDDAALEGPTAPRRDAWRDEPIAVMGSAAFDEDASAADGEGARGEMRLPPAAPLSADAAAAAAEPPSEPTLVAPLDDGEAPMAVVDPFRVDAQRGDPFRVDAQRGDPFRVDAQRGDPFGVDAQRGDPFGADAQRGDPFGTDAQRGDPFGTDAQRGDPFGNEAQRGDPFGNEAQRGDPFGNEAQRGDPFGNEAQRGDPFGADAQRGDPFGADAQRGDPFGADAPQGDPSRIKAPELAAPGSAAAVKAKRAPATWRRRAAAAAPATGPVVSEPVELPVAAARKPRTPRRRAAQAEAPVPSAAETPPAVALSVSEAADAPPSAAKPRRRRVAKASDALAEMPTASVAAAAPPAPTASTGQRSRRRAAEVPETSPTASPSPAGQRVHENGPEPKAPEGELVDAGEGAAEPRPARQGWWQRWVR